VETLPPDHAARARRHYFEVTFCPKIAEMFPTLTGRGCKKMYFCPSAVYSFHLIVLVPDEEDQDDEAGFYSDAFDNVKVTFVAIS
jgi:hypothetical protein